MLIRKFAGIFLVLVLLFATGVTANAATALLTYDFDIELDTATGTNPFGLAAGDTVHMNIVLDKDNPDMSNATYSMYDTIKGLDSLVLTIGGSTYTEDDDVSYGYPAVTIRNDDHTIDTIEYLCMDMYEENDESHIFSITITNKQAGLMFTVAARDETWSFSGVIPRNAIAPVPVPGTAFLLGAGILGLCGIRRKRRL